MSAADTARRTRGNESSVPSLDEEHIEVLRQRLLARARELVAETRSLDDERSEARLATTPGATGTPADQGDEGEQRSRQAVRDAEALRDIDELREIEAALERLDAGHYGECVDCAAEIAVRRLEVQPAAARCLPCQEIHERVHPVARRITP